MWSPGLLFLLLMSSCLPILGDPPDTHKKEELNQESQGNRNKDVSKKLNSWFKNNYRVIGEVVVNSIEPVPVVGPPIAAALKTLLLLIPQADALSSVKSEVKALDVKLENFRADMKWDVWAAGAYQIPVNNIENAWIKYTELVRSNHKTTNTEKETLKEKFCTFYSQYADSTLVLHQFLTAVPPSITQNLGDLLADRLKCHEKDVKAQFLYLNEVMCKGNILNEKYYECKGINPNVNALNKIASQSAAALMKSHQRCLSDGDAFIEREIFELIDDTKKHDEIEENVRTFLTKTYNRFDWLVVAFATHNTKHDPSLLNRHALSGFTKVERGTVTVAVAKQIKGGDTKTAAVIDAIEKCLPRGFKMCLNAAQKLEECQNTVLGKRLSQTYTAVHAFKKKLKKPSTSAGKDDEDFVIKESSSPTNHLFTWDCGKILGKFTVFIKSDEELGSKEKLCSKVNCGQNGVCVVVPETFIAICECEYPYYGEHCELSLESYKRSLQQELGHGAQNTVRFQKSMSVTPANRRSLQPNQGRSARGQSLQPTSRHPADRRSRQSTMQHPFNRRSQQKILRHFVDRRSRQHTQRSSTSGY